MGDLVIHVPGWYVPSKMSYHNTITTCVKTMIYYDQKHDHYDHYQQEYIIIYHWIILKTQELVKPQKNWLLKSSSLG